MEQSSPSRYGTQPAATAARPAKNTGTVAFLSNWINYVCSSEQALGGKPITPETFFQDLSNGLILCRIVQQLVPGADFSKGIFERPVAERSCIANLEKALTITWRQGVRAANMCTATDFLRAGQPKSGESATKAKRAVAKCVAEFFYVLQMRLRDGRTRSRDAILRMNELLVAMGRPLSPHTLSGDVSALHADFAGGTRVMAVLIATGKLMANKAPRLREERHCGNNEVYWLQNGEVLDRALKEIGCPTLLAASEWRSPPEPWPETLQFQLLVLWEFCTTGDKAGPWEWARQVNSQKCDAAIHFSHFLHRHFLSFDDAYSKISQNHMDRLSRVTFMAAMKELGYDGDSKFIWHMLDSETHAGFITRKTWMKLEALAEGQKAPGGEASVMSQGMLGSNLSSPAMLSPDILAQQHEGLLANQNSLMAGSIAKHPQPTTSISAHVVLTDQSQRHISLQTNVANRAAASYDGGDNLELTPALVLEIKERTGLSVVLDVAMILGVEQLDLPNDEASKKDGSSAFNSFVVAIQPQADLRGTDLGLQSDGYNDGLPPNPTTQASMFHKGRGGSILLCFSAGPSPWLREQAQKFFDELRICVYFMQQLEEQGGAGDSSGLDPSS
mmetsp:Transcript_18556/g.39927  ORF Transcript_18556/g.39927 Transcript_18556/m.39927 type:complete len:616 (+) Transcript_18556:104-1951(+)|eukprot:CAMPEP_0206600776 /NCGR_PEP_ID=MMETSP0325_2-20121206/46075_1 /ASSEMBLY_ACC=CAM_ASM_000347 /TAXON_ID=2866 /ORGANISM="Crypthecodinium cohnii, Strain Seligo" /LENGTH=615 /DNA_ID=CAMNT_0054112301 /DNA_START=13 /DNA_END=1860 /DNA_ORIENTATION=-